MSFIRDRFRRLVDQILIFVLTNASNFDGSPEDDSNRTFTTLEELREYYVDKFVERFVNYFKGNKVDQYIIHQFDSQDDVDDDLNDYLYIISICHAIYDPDNIKYMIYEVLMDTIDEIYIKPILTQYICKDVCGIILEFNKPKSYFDLTWH